MTAEQWLSDLEAKAKAAEVTELKIGFPTAQDFDVQRDFAESATPTAVLRLVAMVRIIADRAGKYTYTCPFSEGTPPNTWVCETPDGSCAASHACEMQAAYQQTEPKP